MADTDKKKDGQACACGKTDLYDEWLKQNEKKEDTSGICRTCDPDDAC